MKSTEYIEWDKLEQIPFCLCRIAEDEENQEIDVYYLDKRVCHDYDHVGHYFRTAIIMFRRIRNITADWVNLKNLWLLRDCIRENFNHGLEVDDLIFGETFDGEDPETIKPAKPEAAARKMMIVQSIYSFPQRIIIFYSLPIKAGFTARRAMKFPKPAELPKVRQLLTCCR